MDLGGVDTDLEKTGSDPRKKNLDLVFKEKARSDRQGKTPDPTRSVTATLLSGELLNLFNPLEHGQFLDRYFKVF